MYFPIGWPKHLLLRKQDGPLIHLSCNRDHTMFAALSADTVSLWYCKPAVEITCFKRSANSVCEFGANQHAEWKPDSGIIAISTTKSYIIFYQVEVNGKQGASTLFVMKEERKIGHKKDVFEVSNGNNVPALRLIQTAYIQIQGHILGLVCFRDELMVSTKCGLMQRIKWDGMMNDETTIDIANIPFAVDLQNARASHLGIKDIAVSHLQYSPLLGGFAVVLTNGKAAFITANTLKFEPKQVVGVWAQEIQHATCLAINHKYTLMAFGQTNGQGIMYYLDELTGALQVSHKFVVESKDLPDAGAVCGAVSEMKWSPDGCALAMTWEKGGFSLWSVFGALLTCSLGTEISLTDDMSSHPIVHIKSMEWASEGYHLWMISDGGMRDTTKSNSEMNGTTDSTKPKPQLLQMNFIKSALSVNPCTSNHQHLFLQGEDKLYLSTEDPLLNWSGKAKNPDPAFASGPLFGNRQWQIIPIPHAYVGFNWPIRFAAVHPTGQCVAVAGKTGLAHYALFSRKWKLFGNETQEKDMVVTGGLTWWKDFICAACFNIVDQREEIRFYPREAKLDNTFSHVVRVPSQIMLLNTFHNILIVLCADCHIMIFKLERKSMPNTPTIVVNKLQEVAVGGFIPHPANVVAITMSTLRTETANIKVHPQAYEAESIMLNVAGKLLMFQRDRSGSQLKAKEKDKDSAKDRPLPFCAPVMVASSVEVMWSSPHTGRKPHLTEALWLGCGASGMKVWLPLRPKVEGKMQGFLSNRIMLPYYVEIYPLALFCEGGIILGATSEPLSYKSGSNEQGWAYMQLERTSQIAIHHILRQLLRRNLGVHALELASCCTDLPHFAHAMELLLHEVLEEEATSKEPIPDPLLPRVAAFVQEFPEYLQTVVHCARKTEVALWQYLFNTVGSPRELFEECLQANKLKTAASYLIILQNMEKPSISREHANILLDKALEDCHWDIARDLVRFLSAIDPSEVDSVLPSPQVRGRVGSMYSQSSHYGSPPMSPSENQPYPFPGSIARRGVSVPKDEGSKGDVKKESVKRTKSDTSSIGKSRNNSGSKDEYTAEQFHIDKILSRHAKKLLSAYRLRDLACFSANLEDYQLVGWLRKEKLGAAKVEDFVAALKRLHEDFQWPLPILSLNALPLHRASSASSLHSSVGISEGHQETGINHNWPGSQGPVKFKYNLTSQISYSDTSTSTPGSAEIYLRHQRSLEDISLATEQSDNSSALEELEQSVPGEWTDIPCLTELELLSHELANKGPPQSNVELRYLLEIMLEAGCLEWAVLISVVLRDAIPLVRTVNIASLTDTPIEILGRVREGLSYIELWADTECFGYKPFLTSVQTQIQQLQKLAEDRPPTSRIQNVPTRQTSRISISSNDSTNEGDMGIAHINDNDGLNESQESEEVGDVREGVDGDTGSYECALS